MAKIRVECPQGTQLESLLKNHPRVQTVSCAASGLAFYEEGHRRQIHVGWKDQTVGGLLELCDNNPFVCADEVWVPSPIGTLAAIALGPLCRADLIVEPPVIQSTESAQPGEIAAMLAELGWSGGVLEQVVEAPIGNLLAVSALAVIRTVPESSDISTLFDECYGHSLFVRLAREPWDPQSAAGSPCAFYSLRLTPDVPFSLLNVQVVADRDGKAGDAQLVHVLNIMAGFEESLGIS